MKSFNGKNIIITGGSGGIGRVIAGHFLNLGGTVLIVGLSHAVSRDVWKNILKSSPRVFIITADVSRVAGIVKIKKFIKSKFGGAVDILVNAAGIFGAIGKLEDTDPDLWMKAFEVNVLGTMRMCRLVLPFMKAQKNGRIINFSGGGEGPFPNFTAYSASKGAVVRFTESLAAEVADSGITVNAIAPGAVNSNLLGEVLVAGPKKVGREFYEKSLKQKKEGGADPQKAAELIAFLASPDARRLNGKIWSAIWDNWRNALSHLDDIMKTDVYTMRRIKPRDRGYDW